MSTFGQMVDQVILTLNGFSSGQELSTYTTGSLTNVATTVTVADSTALAVGLAEVGDELVYIASINTGTNTVTFAPFGRGYAGTTAASWSANTQIKSGPRLPKVMVRQAINDTVQAAFPRLFGVGTAQLSTVSDRSTYELPAAAMAVLAVNLDFNAADKEWPLARNYSFNPNADTTDFTSGKSLTLRDYVPPATNNVRVTYAKRPSVMSATSDDFATVTGLPASAEDVIRIGAVMRLAPVFELPRVDGMAAEAAYGASNRQMGSGSQVGRYWFSLYSQRLEEEAVALSRRYPIRVVSS